MKSSKILFGEPEEGYYYDSGTVRARASSARNIIPRLREEEEQLERELRQVRARITMWECYAAQATHLETLRVACNDGKDFTTEEGQHLLFEV